MRFLLNQRARAFVSSLQHGAGFFKVLLQLKCVALHGKVEIADNEAADNVADRAPGQVDVHFMGTGNVGHQRDCTLLVRREPGFH